MALLSVMPVAVKNQSPDSGLHQTTGECMNNIDLQAARKMLFLDPQEAADCIGMVSTRTWQYWEKGEQTVPEDVSEKILALLKKRADALRFGEITYRKDLPAYTYYRTFAEYSQAGGEGNIVDWRLAQSVAAAIRFQD